MPFYLKNNGKSYYYHNLGAGPSTLMLSLSVNVAKNEDLNLDYYQYIKKDFIKMNMNRIRLDEIPKQQLDIPYNISSGYGHILFTGMLIYLFDALDIFKIQVVQAIIDALGCLLVYGILRNFCKRGISISGAILYAIFPVSIFYSYHLLAEAYVPVFMLGIAFFLVKALKTKKWYWFVSGGMLMGVSFGFRMDNIGILPLYIIFIFWYCRKELRKGFVMAALLFFSCILSHYPLTTPNTSGEGSIGAALYSNMAEYPANYQGLRFFNSGPAFDHGVEKAAEYQARNDEAFQSMCHFYETLFFYGRGMKLPEGTLATLAYIREVMIEKPALFINRLLSRFIVYLPSHSFIGAFTYFVDNNWNKGACMLKYRYSNIYQSARWIDHLLFVFFLYGVWVTRNNSLFMSVLCIYIGVHMSHVVLGNGEVFYHMNEEYAYLDPRYLVGMVAIWPVFLAPAFAAAGEKTNKLIVSKMKKAIWKSEINV